MTTSWWWIPVRLVQTGYIRVEAVSAEHALEQVDNQNFDPNELLPDAGIESVEITGPPSMQEVS